MIDKETSLKMISLLVGAGFVGGVLTTLLAIKLLPVKVSFDLGASKATSGIKSQFIKLHPKYCKICKAVPCQDTFGHQY